MSKDKLVNKYFVIPDIEDDQRPESTPIPPTLPASKPQIEHEQLAHSKFISELKASLPPAVRQKINAAEAAGVWTWAKPQPKRTAAQKIRIHEQLALEQELAEGLAEQDKFNKFFSVPSGPVQHISLGIPAHTPPTSSRTVKPANKILSDFIDASDRQSGK